MVTQQISVWQTVQRIQSQPSFFCTTIWHCGQCMASPCCSMDWGRAGADVGARRGQRPGLAPSLRPSRLQRKTRLRCSGISPRLPVSAVSSLHPDTCPAAEHLSQAPALMGVRPEGGQSLQGPYTTAPLAPKTQIPRPSALPSLTLSISVVCRAATSFWARRARSSWYSLQFICSWMACREWGARDEKAPVGNLGEVGDSRHPHST